MFDEEVSLIWGSKWTLVKVLYLLSRYMPFVDATVVSYRKPRLDDQYHLVDFNLCRPIYSTFDN